MEVIPCCFENGISLAPWSPLGGGWLTGKYTSTEMPEEKTRLGEDPNRGVEAYGNRNNEKTYRILEVMKTIAKRHERPISHIALAWLLTRPTVATLLLGARTVGQLQENIQSITLQLDESEVLELTKVSKIGLPEYPYKFLADWSEVGIWEALGT